MCSRTEDEAPYILLLWLL